MLDRVYSINNEKWLKNWTLGDNLGLPFENHLFNVISCQMSNRYGKNVHVYDTPGSRDDGKDIIIESFVDIMDFMGRDFFLKGKESIKVYLECKSSDSGKISWNQIAGNVARVENDNIDYYVLITNTTIVPYTFYQFSKSASDKNIQFTLIDQPILVRYLEEQNAFIGELKEPVVTANQNIIYEYQVLSYKKDLQNQFEIYLMIRNYSSETEKIEISLGSDHDWTLSPDSINVAVEKNGMYCTKLLANRNFYDGIEQLNIIFNINNLQNVIALKGVKLDFDFIPPMHGEQHYKILDDLECMITTSSLLQVRYMFGEAGCGKSRIIEELYKRLSGRNVDLIQVKCVPDKEKTLKKLQSSLRDKKILCSKTESTDLVTNISQISTRFRKCVLILEDIHNLPELIIDLKKVAHMHLSKAITVIISGRNDYSVGNADYYSFLQWCEANIEGDIVNKLKPEESKKLITSIINDAPQKVVETILKKSDRNPLFIIQFIEYFLDLNLAHIINRTTIGILNVDSFSTMKDMPDQIEKIYKNRCKLLQEEQNGAELIKFLYIAAFIGSSFPKEVAILYFKDNSNLVDLLIQRKFLAYTMDGNLEFVHETLYMFFRKKLMQSSKMQDIWKELLGYSSFVNDLDKGVILYKNKDFEGALKFLGCILEACEEMENYSSFNANPKYYAYLDFVYDIAKKLKKTESLKKVIIYKVYTALHYYTPIEAVNECISATKRIQQDSFFHRDNAFICTLTDLKAHGYMNAGRLKNAEQYLLECLSMSLLYPSNFNLQSKFDMYDRLAGLYIKYNDYELANNYNKLATQLAENADDEGLLSLAYITNAKLNLYSNSDDAQRKLAASRKLLETKRNSRLFCHNEISIIIQEFPYQINNDLWRSEAMSIINNILQISIENNYASSIIRSYLVLAALEFFDPQGKKDFSLVKKFIDFGIDASIKFGIATYIWEFYNLKFIIAVKLHESADYIMKIVETIKRMLRQQNLCYLGSMDFCYANILVLTNIARYYTREKEFYEFMNSISYNNSYNSGCNFDCDSKNCVYVCENTLAKFKDEYDYIHNEDRILFQEKSITYSLIDTETKYYLALS